MPLMIVFTAGFRNYFQGIDIEEAFPVQLHAADDAIVKRLLHDIRVFSQFFQLQHTPCKEDKTDRRAGLTVNGIVRQIIVKGKGLSVFAGSDRAGNIQSSLRDAVPHSAA